MTGKGVFSDIMKKVSEELDAVGIAVDLGAVGDGLDAILDERELESLRMGCRERVTDMHLPQIAELPQVLPELFANAAVRAKEAGFDGVELHYAHAYTMSSLLSRLNTRDDGYGGPLENRLRLPLEGFSAVREAVGEDYTVGCRYLADDIVEGGNTVEDAARIGVVFAGDLLTLFLFWELMALASTGVILAAGTKGARKAALRYLSDGGAIGIFPLLLGVLLGSKINCQHEMV